MVASQYRGVFNEIVKAIQKTLELKSKNNMRGLKAFQPLFKETCRQFFTAEEHLFNRVRPQVAGELIEVPLKRVLNPHRGSPMSVNIIIRQSQTCFKIFIRK